MRTLVAIMGMLFLLTSGCGSSSDKGVGNPKMSQNRLGDQPEFVEPDEARSQVVLGEQLAKAAAAEKKRTDKGNLGKSPMPEKEYDRQNDDLGLLRPRQVPLDFELAELTRKFAKVDNENRATIRGSISMDEFYTLLAFSKRAAVFALREKKNDWVTNGLTAIAMIEAERVDWRDILMALSLLNHAAVRIGVDSDRLFREAGRLSEPGVGSLIDGFIERSENQKILRSSWGYDEVEIDGQLGFIGCESQPYQPTSDLVKVAIQIADFIAKDKYCPDSISIATDLPPIWLQTKDNSALEKALKSIRACVTINAQLRRGEHKDSDKQMFVVFLVETMDASAATTLLKLARTKQTESYAMLGVAEKNLFCLVIARSVFEGADSFETTEKLNRLSDGVSGILHRQ